MKKIMFNDKYRLTEAVLEGRKTMTRRMVPEHVIIDGKIFALGKSDPSKSLREYILYKSPYKVGEIVAISQSYKQLEDEIERQGLPLLLKEAKKVCAAYKNKMYVQAEDMPHHIKINSVKAEFIQDISTADCLKEGILLDKHSLRTPKIMYTYIGGRLFEKAQWAFHSLFIKTGCKQAQWDRNEWVYAYEFELVD